jgi:hypothetical protein
VSKLLEILAEQRIVDAIGRGELDRLPGAGRPLEFDDDLLVSPAQRMVNKVLKNAGFAPAEVLLRRKIADLRKEIHALPAGERRRALRRQLAMCLLQLDCGKH